jgi:hypothetical protein
MRVIRQADVVPAQTGEPDCHTQTARSRLRNANADELAALARIFRYGATSGAEQSLTGEYQLIDGKLGGIAVTSGARVASQAARGQVLVSSTSRRRWWRPAAPATAARRGPQAAELVPIATSGM